MYVYMWCGGVYVMCDVRIIKKYELKNLSIKWNKQQESIWCEQRGGVGERDREMVMVVLNEIIK